MKNKIEEIYQVLSDNADFIGLDNIEKFLSVKSYIKDLEHHKDTTVGLYAIDFNPKELIKRFVNSQSDATRLAVEDVEDLVEDWVRFIEDKNIRKSPFFQIY